MQSSSGALDSEPEMQRRRLRQLVVRTERVVARAYNVVGGTELAETSSVLLFNCQRRTSPSQLHFETDGKK